MSPVYSVDDVAKNFRSLPSDEHVLVDVGAQDPIAIKCQASKSPNASALVILFHGAVSRSKGTPIPAFLNFRRAVADHAHQVSIADPGVEPSNRVGIGWFAGSDRNFAQELLPGFFKRLEKALGLDRTIYVGSSAGGFGALFYSWHHAGSTVCASVPQTNAWAYAESSRRFFLEDCWPKGISNYEHPPVLDLRELYSKTVPNNVVYIQSSMDDRHLKDHMVPFLGSLPSDEISKLALKVSYWGRPGHSGAVPPGELDGWIRAAISSHDSSAESIVAEYQQSGVEITPMSEVLLKEAGAKRGPARRPSDSLNQKLLYRDLNWAKIVAETNLREGED